jgi:hypothetical protein
LPRTRVGFEKHPVTNQASGITGARGPNLGSAILGDNEGRFQDGEIRSSPVRVPWYLTETGPKLPETTTVVPEVAPFSVGQVR